MPTTRSTPGSSYARNYQQSTFRSLWKGRLPTGINKMITRALRAFGPDNYVLSTIWTEPVTTGDGTTMTEAKYFGNKSYSNDICCADTVSWVVYQSGVADLVKNPKQIHPDGNVHYVDDFMPDKPWNKGVLKLVAVYDDSNPTAKESDFLPGDYLIYVDSATLYAQGNGHHINCYIGPFVETDGGEDVGDVYNLINGSLTTSGPNAFVTPDTWQREVNGRKGGHVVVHGRFVAIERLFADAIGLPVNLKLAQAGAAPSDTDRLWSITRDARAPYPVGVNFAWHEGVHIPAGGDVDDRNEVWAVAPGEIVAARLGSKEPTPEGDASFVLMRHRLLRSRRTLLGPREVVDDPKASPFFVLYMHLTPAAAYVDPAAEKLGGVDALGEKAPLWLRKLWPVPVPRRGSFVRSGTPISLLVAARKTDGSIALVSLGSDKSLHVTNDLAVAGVETNGKIVSPPLEKITVGGTAYYVVPQPSDDATNASFWDADRPAAVAPPGKSVLAYYNPLDGSIIATNKRLPPAAQIAMDKGADSAYHVDLRTSSGKTYARIDTFTRPGFRAQKAQVGTATDDATGKEMVHFADKVKTVEMFLDTVAEGKDRDFIGDSIQVSTQLQIEATGLPESTGKRKAYEKLWVKLVPVVLYTEDQRDAAEKTVNEASAKARREAKERLEKRQSRVVGAMLLDTEGWVNDETGHAISPAQGATPRFYTRISRDKSDRKLRVFKQPDPADKPRDFDDTRIGFGDAAGAAIFPLEVFKDKKKRAMALVEVVYAVPVDKAEEIDKKWVDDSEADNKDRAAIAKALFDGEVVDLRKKLKDKKPKRGDLLSAESGYVSGELLGHLGTISRAPGQDAQKGIHFEIFAGKSLILGEGSDPAAPPDGPGKYPDQAITPIPKSGFLVFKDLADKDLLNPAFLRNVADKLAKLDQPALDFKALPGVFKDQKATPKELNPQWVPTPDEWISFCNTNQRQLSRIVSVHPSEWALDWPESLAGDKSTQNQQSEARKKELTQAHKTLAWIPSFEFVPEDGIESKDALFFYHPVRFIELIKTGLDVAIRLRDEKKKADVKVTLVLDPDAREIPLEQNPKDDLYSYRLHVGEVKSEATGHLKLEGVATKYPEIPVKIVRGEIHRIQLIEPDAAISVEHEQPWMNFAMAIKQQVVDNSVSGVHLLPDGRAHLTRSGYSRAAFRISAYYNEQMPDKLTLELAGDGFRISAWSLQGAVAKTMTPAVPAMPQEKGLPPRHVPALDVSKVDMTLAPVNKPDLYSENVRTLSVVVEIVITPKTQLGQTATLTASLDGGDLAAPWQGKATVLTRPKIERNDSGQDVAELEVYLSQIFAADEGPCFRLTDQGGDDCLCSPYNRPGIVINGKYDDALRRALWRFIYTYGSRSDWTASVHSSTGTTMPKELHDFAARHADWNSMPHLDETTVGTDADVKKFVERVEFGTAKKDLKAPVGLKPDALDWPIVDAPLLREIVGRFTTGNILPSLDFTVSPLGLPATRTPGSPPVDASGAAALKGSRILPWDGYRVMFQMLWNEAERASAGDDEVELRLSPTSAYRLLPSLTDPLSKATTTVKTTVDKLLAGTMFVLVWNSAAPDPKPDNVLRAFAVNKADSQIASATLSGPRDFLSDVQDRDRDAALVQLALTQIPQKKKAEIGFVPNRKKTTVVDGKWSKMWAAVLQVFASDYGLPKMKSAELVQALMAVYMTPPTAAPAAPPATTPPRP